MLTNTEMPPVITTPSVPFSILHGMKQLVQDFSLNGRRHRKGFPLLIASSRTEVTLFSQGHSVFPVTLRSGKVIHEEQEIPAIFIDYWVDNDPQVASGIVRKESLTLVREAQGIRAYHYSPLMDAKGTTYSLTSQDLPFRKQAEKLWKAVRKATAVSLKQLPTTQSSLYFPKEQHFASQLLLAGIVGITNHNLPNAEKTSFVSSSRRMVPLSVLRDKAA